MKKILTLIAAVVVLGLPAFALADAWQIDQEHSNVAFKVRHMMVSNVKGDFGKFSGVVDIDNKDVTKSKVAVNIDIASVNTGVTKRDEHLKSADFFDAGKYPTMTFVSRRVTKAGKDRLKVAGLLTLHGVAKEVVLDVEGLSGAAKDPWGNLRRGASASTRISRKDFGLTWNAALETGGVAVGDEVLISLEIEMTKK
ncbi:MAG TPA: YceI family protein [Geomonas sp.]